MKNAILFHGTGSDPNSFWFPYVKSELELKHISVWIPALPETDTPDIKKWLPVALKGTYSDETLIIGHSAGCPLTLSVLESIDVKISRAIFVSGYARNIWHDKENKLLQQNYDWEKIKHNVKEFYFINSDNDPWGCNETEGKYLFDKLGGTQIIRHGEGHMGSVLFKQPYEKFPFLLKFIL